VPSGELIKTTALIVVAVSGRLEVARLLLDAGADPSCAASNGDTSLIGVALRGRLEVLRLLLARSTATKSFMPGGAAVNMVIHLRALQPKGEGLIMAKMARPRYVSFDQTGGVTFREVQPFGGRPAGRALAWPRPRRQRAAVG
jgi:hypothetical protein